MRILGYKAAEGARFNDKQAAMYGAELVKVFPRRAPTPDEVVQAAKVRSSPLHSFFEWDDAKAAAAHRRDMASYLLRHIRVTYDTPEGPKLTRLYVTLTAPGAAGVAGDVEHQLSVRVASDPEMRARYVAQLHARLRSLSMQLREFEEFSAVVAAIDALERERGEAA